MFFLFGHCFDFLKSLLTPTPHPMVGGADLLVSMNDVFRVPLPIIAGGHPRTMTFFVQLDRTCQGFCFDAKKKHVSNSVKRKQITNSTPLIYHSYRQSQPPWPIILKIIFTPTNSNTPPTAYKEPHTPHKHTTQPRGQHKVKHPMPPPKHTRIQYMPA